MKTPLIALFSFTIIFIALKLFAASFFEVGLWRNQVLNFLYVWSPGFVGLYFAKKEKLALPLFRKLGSGFIVIPLYGIAIALIGLLLSIPLGLSAHFNDALFGPEATIGKQIGKVVVLLFTSYILPLFFMLILFFGGEIFWRGYFWQKLKKLHPFKAVWLITLVWIIWQLPIAYFAITPGLASPWLSLIMGALIVLITSPLLFYFRLRYKAVLASALCYSALYAGFLWIGLLFQNTFALQAMNLYGACHLAATFIVSLALKLYFPNKWEKLASRHG